MNAFRTIIGAVFLSFSGAVCAASATVFGVSYDTGNATTQTTITGGGYATPFGPALFSGGSDDWVAPDAIGNSLGTMVQVAAFQPEFDPGSANTGNVGSSVTLGGSPGHPTLTNTRDIIRTRWDTGWGLTNEDGDDLAIYEKATSEAFAIRVHNATSLSWTPWYFEIFEQPSSDDFGSVTLYDLAHFGLGDGDIINAIEIMNLTPEDTVATSSGEFDLGVELGFGVVTLDGAPGGYAPARRRTAPSPELKRYEIGKHDPDILYVVGLTDIDPLIVDVVTDPPSGGPEPAVVPLPPALYLFLSALGAIALRGRRRL